MSKDIKIESGILMSKSRKPLGGKYISTFAKMNVGDSFWIKDRNSIHASAKHAKVRIATRSDGDGYRVWMISKRTSGDEKKDHSKT